MAWVRPKHPKKEPVDPVETFLPMLSFFGGRRPPTRPKLNKNPKPTVLLSRDPILRSIQQAQEAQALHAEEPTTSHSHKTSTRKSHEQYLFHEDDHEASLDVESELEEHYERMTQRPLRSLKREPSPPPSPPVQPRVIQPKPRALSYERPVPKAVVKDRPPPRGVPLSRRSRDETSRVISSRWVSATTPLELWFSRLEDENNLSMPVMAVYLQGPSLPGMRVVLPYSIPWSFQRILALAAAVKLVY